MSKVYLVYWCNNESYEDYYEGVKAVCATHEGAEGYILSKGCKPRIREGWEPKRWKPRYDSEPDEYGEYYSMWIEEMEVQQ